MSETVPGFDDLTFTDSTGPKQGTYGWALNQPNSAQYGIKGLSSYVYALLHKNKLLPDRTSYNKTFRDRFGKYVQEYVETGTTTHPLLKPALDKLRKQYPADKWDMQFGRGSKAADRSFNYDITFQHKKRGFFDTYALTDKEQLTATQALSMSMAGPGLGQLRQIGFFNPFLKTPFQAEDALRADQVQRALFADHSVTRDPEYAPISTITQKGTKPPRVPKGFNGNKSFVSLDFETTGKTGRPGVLGWSLARYDYNKKLDDWVMRRMDSRFYYPTQKDLLNPEYDEAQSVTHLDPANIARLRGDKAGYHRHWDEHERKALLHKIGNMPILTMNGAQFDLNILTGRDVGHEFTAYSELKSGFWDLQHLAEGQRGKGKGRNTLDRLYKAFTDQTMEEAGLEHHDPRSDVIAAATILRELRKRHGNTRMGQAAAQLLATKGSYTQSRSGMLPENVLEEIVLDRRAHKKDVAGGLGKMTPIEDALGITAADKEAGLTADDFEELDIAAEIKNDWQTYQDNLKKMNWDPSSDRFLSTARGREINFVMNKPRTPGRGSYPTKSSPYAYVDKLEYLKGVAKDLSNDDWGDIPRNRQWGRSAAVAAKALFKHAAHQAGYKGSKYYAARSSQAHKFWDSLLPVSTGVSGKAYADVLQAQADVVFNRGIATSSNDDARYQAWLESHQSQRHSTDIRDQLAERRAAILADARRNSASARLDRGESVSAEEFMGTSFSSRGVADLVKDRERGEKLIQDVQKGPEKKAWSEADWSRFNTGAKALDAFIASLQTATSSVDTLFNAGMSAYNTVSSATGDLMSSVPGLSRFRGLQHNWSRSWAEQAKSGYLNSAFTTAKFGLQAGSGVLASTLMGVKAGAAFGNPVVGGLVGAGIGLVTQGAQYFANRKGAQVQAVGEHAASVLHLWAGYADLIFAPLKIAANGLRVSFNLLTNQFRAGMRDFNSLGLPLTNLTGLAYPGYQYSTQADHLFHLSNGATSAAYNTMENRAQALYAVGHVDTNHIIASALLGQFSEAYAADGNTEEHYTNMINATALRIRNAGSQKERARLMYLAGQVDSTMPSRLQQMANLGITDYREFTNGSFNKRRNVYFRALSSNEEHQMEGVRYDWQVIQDQFHNSRMRIITSVWEWAKGILNAGNRIMDMIAQGDYKSAGSAMKEAASNVWKKITEVWNNLDIDLGGIWDKVKGLAEKVINVFGPTMLRGLASYTTIVSGLFAEMIDAVKVPLGNFLRDMSHVRVNVGVDEGGIHFGITTLSTNSWSTGRTNSISDTAQKVFAKSGIWRGADDERWGELGDNSNFSQWGDEIFHRNSALLSDGSRALAYDELPDEWKSLMPEEFVTKASFQHGMNVGPTSVITRENWDKWVGAVGASAKYGKISSSTIATAAGIQEQENQYVRALGDLSKNIIELNGVLSAALRRQADEMSNPTVRVEIEAKGSDGKSTTTTTTVGGPEKTTDLLKFEVKPSSIGNYLQILQKTGA